MICVKYLLSLCLVFRISYGQNTIFRKDYTYLEATKSFYKIHTVHKEWHDAKYMCELEGATMFYPSDEDEVLAVVHYWNKTQPYSWIFVGISAPTVKHVFETVDGKSIGDVYARWSSGEPNDAGGNENCVVLRRDGKYNDEQCNKTFPFICKKTQASVRWNVPCNLPDNEYEYYAQTSRCYKFHTEPKSWTGAYATCDAEQSRLAVINSEEEANILVQITNKAQKDDVEGDFIRGAVHLGFKNKNGWKILPGNLPLKSSGYTTWGKGQPDGQGKEMCGSMFYNGHLNDISCDAKCFFICEHEIDLLAYTFDLKFGTGQN